MEQRIIKFKAKRLDNGKWVTGDLLQVSEKDVQIYNKDCGGNFYPIDPSTVCQFTGLKDERLTPIYEGDIIQNPEFPFEKRTVTWVNHQAGYMPIDEEGHIDRDFSFLVLFKKWTVIDNKVRQKGREMPTLKDARLLLIGSLIFNSIIFVLQILAVHYVGVLAFLSICLQIVVLVIIKINEK